MVLCQFAPQALSRAGVLQFEKTWKLALGVVRAIQASLVVRFLRFSEGRVCSAVESHNFSVLFLFFVCFDSDGLGMRSKAVISHMSQVTKVKFQVPNSKSRFCL